LFYPWHHSDAGLDRLCADIQTLIQTEERRKAARLEIFGKIWEVANNRPPDFRVPSRATIPYLNEPWYC
jgi:hypothetical protein